MKGGGVEITRSDERGQHPLPFLRTLKSTLPSLTGFRRSSLGFNGLETILADFPFARAVTAPPEGP